MKSTPVPINTRNLITADMIGPDGYRVGADKIYRDYYPPIPVDVEMFQSGTGYGSEKPVAVHGWGWSDTFGSWRALVDFADGWHGFTSPDPVAVYRASHG